MATGGSVACQPAERAPGPVVSNSGGLRKHDGIGHERAASGSRACVISPGDLQVVAPPSLRLSSNRQRDVDRCQVGECQCSRRVEDLMAETAIGAGRAARNLKRPIRLYDLFNPVPLQARDVEDAWLVGRDAPKANSEKIEAEARILTQLSDADLSGGRL